jgi:nucleoside-diphosphate-sugar epimerase
MKNILVTGGAGFIGSHLCDRLIENGNKVVCVDNFITGNRSNIDHLRKNKNFVLIEADASEDASTYLKKYSRIDEIYHLASPASPRGYQEAPIATYKVNSFGTHHLLTFAQEKGVKFLFASTSEVYGDPQIHPQKESYWGNVNPHGVRACYDESKRFGEMVCMVFFREFGLDVRVVRIFNTYGPRMHPKDGRVIPNFITQALQNKPITVNGDGSQTRSFCYVSDIVEGIMKAMSQSKTKGQVFNLGNPDEYTMLNLAKKVKKIITTQSKIVFKILPEDDPAKRKPDISKTHEFLDWNPKVKFDQGLKTTIEYFKLAAK